MDVRKLAADLVQVLPEVPLGREVLFFQVGDFVFGLLVLLQRLGEIAEKSDYRLGSLFLNRSGGSRVLAVGFSTG